MASLANVLRNNIGHGGERLIYTNSSHGAHGGREGHVFNGGIQVSRPCLRTLGDLL